MPDPTPQHTRPLRTPLPNTKLITAKLITAKLIAATLLTALLHPAAWGADAVPQVLDERLQLALIAAEPDLVTPVGIAADAEGTLYVVENHTHFRPEDYDGPAGDRIVVFTSTTGDARQVPRVFYTGLRYAMQLAVHPSEPWLYVATRSEVLRLRDTNGDQVADERQTLLKLETAGDYPHNGLSGMLFDATGNLWVGMGENLGATYRLVGSDGQSISGGGEGGNLFWCRADGSQMRNYATGFWNPFALASDPAGRLFAVDNDPDSRPPCRLLHVVEHGDYGFRFRNGRRGVYPFTAWNGEIPGTLPMVAGTGEAPSGLVCYTADSWPADYRGTLLGGSWGSHRIEQFRLTPRGASWQGERVSVVQGDERFRPVGLAIAPDGALWFTDWVDKSYPLHKQGRLWRLSARQTASRPQPNSANSDPLDAMRQLVERREWEGAERLALGSGTSIDAWHALLSAADYTPQQLTWERLPASDELRAILLRRRAARAPGSAIIERLSSTDPFVRQAARVGLEQLGEAEYSAIVNDPRVALAPDTILARRNRHERPDAATFERWLSADDRQTRFVALQWMAESLRTDCRSLVDRALRASCDTRELFAAALATLERLDHPEDDIDEERSWVEYAAPLLSDPQLDANLLVRVLRILPPDHPALTAERWKQLWSHADAGVRVDAVRSWRLRSGPEVAAQLLVLATDTGQPSAVRAEAMVGLDPRDPDQQRVLERLASDLNGEVSAEAQRTVRLAESHSSADAAVSADAAAARLRQRIDTVARATGGDRRLGERLFFHPRVASCYRCHQWQGRGAELGPSLGGIGQSSDRRRLVESLLDPSREIAPQYVPWSIELEDGRILTGMLIAEDDQNRTTYVDQQGQTFTLEPGEVAARHPLTASIMPVGLADQLTDAELGSLVEFLRGERYDTGCGRRVAGHTLGGCERQAKLKESPDPWLWFAGWRTGVREWDRLAIRKGRGKMGSESQEKAKLDSAATERMERWLLSDELRDFIQLHREPDTHPGRLGPYITVSRESGAGGGHVAREIGRQLGWDVLDKELLDCVAQRYHMPRDLLEIVDEKKAHVIQELMRNFFARRSVSNDQYVMNVEHVIYLAAVHGRVVIVGRGAHCVLPREHGLAVRFIAPRAWRIRHMMERRGVAQREAERVIDATDGGRTELCKYYLGQDSSDPHNFDLVVNVEHLGHEQAARMVADLARHRFQLPEA